MKKLFKRFFKSAFSRWLTCIVAAQYIRLVYYTSARQVEIAPMAEPYMRGDLPVIFAFWHGRMLMMTMVRPPKRKGHVFISTHRDGELVAGTMEHFGLSTVRGSTRRGGGSAALRAVKVLQAGDNLVMTPDGPRGPLMKVQPGLLAIAQMAGVPVIPASYSSTRHKRMRTWDRFMVALPFGRIYYCIGAPMTDATPEALEKEMVRLTEEADKKAGVA
jgi:lysophospholipid acyltransferase (LPLAT)-like uncharacterized protein